ncbi:hypothetical protein [Actinomyces qiguomingii]|uniref:hypothetical protein n=1 Tax=Actinomyces qiguomingii TaxID=2057800 RepID=UPI000CA041D3|nr:hypothetical protein [Actinomyces qiguomingii]
MTATLVVFCFGWLAMKSFWEFGYRNEYSGTRGLPYYLSANWGDPLILPAIGFLITYEIQQSLTAWTALKRKVTLAGGLLGIAVGAASQFQWTHSGKTILNWTFNPDGSFNPPGWYHAVYLTAMCGFLLGGLAALTALGLGRSRSQWERGSVLRYLAIGYLFVLFSCLLATDNRRGLQEVTWTEASATAQTLLIPLIMTVLVTLIGVALGCDKRLLIMYVSVLAITSATVPTALLLRGMTPVSNAEVAYCGTAALFALSFVTAPASSRLLEQLLRSLPGAVIVWVSTLAVSGMTIEWTVPRIVMAVLVITAVVGSVALLPCAYDVERMTQRLLATASSVLLLVMLFCFALLPRFISNVSWWVGAYGAFVALVAGRWIVWNFEGVTSKEEEVSFTWYSGASGNAGVDGSEVALRNERVIRYKVLLGFAAQATVVLLLLVVAYLAMPAEDSSKAIPRVIACCILVMIMTQGSYFFSRLSFRSNVYVLRGIDMTVGNRTRAFVGGFTAAVFSGSYGVVLAVWSSTKVTLLHWAVFSALYVVLLGCLCRMMLIGVDGWDVQRWPCLSSPLRSLAQDHVVSLALMNILGIGILIWISDRLSTPSDVAVAGLFITLPLAAVYTFFVANNMHHIDRETGRIHEQISGRSASEVWRGEQYLVDLRNHCIAQNKISALIVVSAMLPFFARYVVGSRGGLDDAKGLAELFRLYGHEELYEAIHLKLKL